MQPVRPASHGHRRSDTAFSSAPRAAWKGRSWRTSIWCSLPPRRTAGACWKSPRQRMWPYTLTRSLGRPSRALKKRTLSLSSGNMEYHPNVTAVRHFRRRVWPLIESKAPSLRWRLIGKNEFAVRSLVADDPRIDLTGPVADAVGELARAKVVVVPLLAGSGTRVKILEAWAAGRAVVSTAIGADGLAVQHGENIRIADGPREMAEMVLELLNDELARKRMGEQGRKTYEAGFSWPAAWETFKPHFHKLMSREKVLAAI